MSENGRSRTKMLKCKSAMVIRVPDTQPQQLNAICVTARDYMSYYTLLFEILRK